MSNFVDLRLPISLGISNIFAASNLTPLKKLELMDADIFEELTEVWAYEKIGKKYTAVKRFAGPGDKGRDVVGYYKEDYPQIIDIYQCKHYKEQIAPSDILIEFEKLCYYTFIATYSVPKRYYIVSPKGCGTTLRTDYIDKPSEINEKVCKDIINNKVKIDKVNLDSLSGFMDYVKKFDFSIIKEITPMDLIGEFRKSKYYPYYLPGGLEDFQPEEVKVPDVIQKEEENYVKQLFEVYSEYEKKEVLEVKQISRKYKKHFEMQRTYYYTIESFRRAVRDSLPNMDLFNEVEELIDQGVNDIIIDPELNGYERLKDSLERSTNMNLDACKLRNYLKPNDKKGVCHRLANEFIIRWVLDEA
ncbi:restriction endonuclease [Clostridium sporogenes]|uniref:ABC-three component system protein n=1 Tax=Clostridium sporogenes TaxID=1509 RepID=UPI0022380FE5|nr:ABC-three component system protein [Clostridium sporogenes]MCW6091726.1 restriction endonuclease [Clostridium sporogenes]MCW6091731.1 restriction endonuclease [Clostridium sporogenes]